MDLTPGSLSAAAFYTGLLILLGVTLQIQVIRHRQAANVGIGHGEHRGLELAIRAHGNFAENAPIGIGALAMLALIGAPAVVVHGVGGLLLVGRSIHAFGFSKSAGPSIGRVAGMLMTFLALGLAAIILIVRAVW